MVISDKDLLRWDTPIEVHYMQSVYYATMGSSNHKKEFLHVQATFLHPHSTVWNAMKCCNATWLLQISFWHGWNMCSSRRRPVMKKPRPFCEAVSAQFEKMPELDDGHWVTKAFDRFNFLSMIYWAKGLAIPESETRAKLHISNHVALISWGCLDQFQNWLFFPFPTQLNVKGLI